MERSVSLTPVEIAPDQLSFFRWGRVAGRVLITTDAGDWSFLDEAQFADLLAGRIAAGHPRFEELQSKGFVRDGLDVDALAARVAQRNRHMRRGPHVHVVTLTLRGTGGAQPGTAGTDMDAATAEKVVDVAMQTTSPSLTFVLRGQGGEPLLNFEVLRQLVESAQTRNKRTVGKVLDFQLFSNFSALTPEIADWLVEHDVRVGTSLDGPAALHDANRRWKGGSAHADVVRWIEYFDKRYAERGRDAGTWQVDALLSVTRATLGAGREVVDEYVKRGRRVIHLRPLSPAGLDPALWREIGYSGTEYLAFYRQTLDYILDLNRRGIEIMDRMATILALKILTIEDPGIVDIQSPCGEGTGQIAYGVDGRVYPCDEARLVDALGDPIFELGDVRSLNLGDVARHPTVRAIAAASLLDAQPMCATCWNKPFCGFSPVRNFLTQGDLFGQRPHCLQCKEHMAISTHLFELLADERDTAGAEILRRWTTTRPPSVIDGRSLQEAP